MDFHVCGGDGMVGPASVRSIRPTVQKSVDSFPLALPISFFPRCSLLSSLPTPLPHQLHFFFSFPLLFRENKDALNSVELEVVQSSIVDGAMMDATLTATCSPPIPLPQTLPPLHHPDSFISVSNLFSLSSSLSLSWSVLFFLSSFLCSLYSSSFSLFSSLFPFLQPLPHYLSCLTLSSPRCSRNPQPGLSLQEAHDRRAGATVVAAAGG